MAVNFAGNIRGSANRMPLVAGLLMLVAIATALLLIAAGTGTFDSFQYIFLVPWVLGLGVVFAVPSLILYYRGEFSFANPIVFSTFSYFVPAFFVGGLLLATGNSEPYYLSYIQDPGNDLPLTIVVIGLGFISLSAGYFVPLGKRVQVRIAASLPAADRTPNSLIIPGLLLLLIGVGNTVFAFAVGLFGYQFSPESLTYAGLIYMATLLRVEASFLLWLVVFRQKNFSATSYFIIAAALTVDIGTAIFAGNRGTLISVIAMVLLAFVFSGREFRFRHGVIVSVLVAIGIIAGMIYGTTFRIVKGTESRQSSSEYADNIVRTFEEVGRNTTYDSLSFGLRMLSERLDIVSTLAVVVSNHEKLKPYEEAYGLDNNIWTDTTTFFVPRIFWTDKPVASDARKYSDLYFNVSETSFAITPMGDLLRNFGLVGIPIGMFALGVVLRFIYSTLIAGRGTPIWRCVMYFMLLTAVSYEGFYGTIIPTVIKVGITAGVGVLFVTFLARLFEQKQANING